MRASRSAVSWVNIRHSTGASARPDAREPDRREHQPADDRAEALAGQRLGEEGDDADDPEHDQQPAAEEAGGRAAPVVVEHRTEPGHLGQRLAPPLAPARAGLVPDHTGTQRHQRRQPADQRAHPGRTADHEIQQPDTQRERDKRHQLSDVAPTAIRVRGQNRPEHRVQDGAQAVGEREGEERYPDRDHRCAEVPWPAPPRRHPAPGSPGRAAAAAAAGCRRLVATGVVVVMLRWSHVEGG